MRDPGCLVRPHVRGTTSRKRYRPSRSRPRQRRSGQGQVRQEASRQEDRRRRRRPGRPRPPARQGDQDSEQDHAEGAHPRQPAGADAVRRGGRRQVPDRQPAAGGGAAAGARRSLGAVDGPDPRRGRGPVPRLPEQPQRGSPAAAGAVQRSSTWRARWSVSAASAPARAWCCCRAATATTRCSCRSRRRPDRSWRSHLPKSRFHTPGQRVVEGQRLMQAASRHLPRLDQGGPGRPFLLLAPAA